MRIAPFRGTRFDPERVALLGGGEFTAPPYDIIDPEEHRALLSASRINIVRLTLGDRPGRGGDGDYPERGRLLREWRAEGVLRRDPAPGFYVMEIAYSPPGAPASGGAPGTAGDRRRFLGLVALGRLAAFEEGIVLPHEQTFPQVVDDRSRLLEATRANLEPLFLLCDDPAAEIDALLDATTRQEPLVRVEARPGEIHSLYFLPAGSEPGGTNPACDRLRELMAPQRPIIADGHHRYTTRVRFDRERDPAEPVPGSRWALMTFANLWSDGLSILATHRLLRLPAGRAAEALDRLAERCRSAPEGEGDFVAETPGRRLSLRFPEELRSSREGVARTDYALLHEVVIAEWLRPWTGEDPDVGYYKQGTGEDEALRDSGGGKGILFRMRPVAPGEFRDVVAAGEVFPHKTTFFYPKLWSGLVLWPLEEP